MVKQPPCMSDGLSFLSRALIASSRISWEISTSDFWSDSRITGTTSPLGVSTATPMLKYFFSISFSPLASSELLKRGKAFSEATTAQMMKASGVILMPSFSISLPICLRKASISVMSASSNWVTCGMVSQLRCRNSPVSLLILDSVSCSVSPNWLKSISGAGLMPSEAPPLPPLARAFFT